MAVRNSRSRWPLFAGRNPRKQNFSAENPEPTSAARIDDGPGTTKIYSVPAHPHYDGDGEDRVLLIRVLDNPRA